MEYDKKNLLKLLKKDTRTYRSLGTILGLSASYVWKLKTDKHNPSDSTLAKLYKEYKNAL